MRPDAGRAWVDGINVVERPHAVRARIGLAGQYAAVDAYLTGRENLVMVGRLSGLSRTDAHRRADELLERLDLASAGIRPARTYSGGMRRRLDLAASLVTSPSVLFLDEPTTGLDPRGRTELWNILGELTDQGTSLLLTTQYMEEADRLADAIVIIDAGTVIASGTSNELKSLVGGDRLELTPTSGEERQRLAAALESLGSGPPVVDRAGHVLIPVDNGPAVLADLSSRLASSGVQITDLSLRRPSLDDVFLALTNGDHAESNAP